MFKTASLASALLLSASTIALAADAVDEVPVAPVAIESPAFTWTGAYVGIQGGAGWLEGKADFFGIVDASRDFDGGVIGGFAGYNWQFSNGFVAGIEGDFDYNFNEERILGADMGTDWSGTVRGRLGYAFDRFMVYGAAGWTMTNGYVKFLGREESETFSGWTAAAGVDYAVTDKIFVRGEYRHNDFGDKDIIRGVNVALDQDVVKVGLGVKF
ncbi:outer membrane protein [Neorhizobium sp. NPDC001467]|uniref:outer membrane protein n=1 Tax=Neorhizobium sp. NPDC001467 TaxID=3390595 RepID=UPI003CFC6126